MLLGPYSHLVQLLLGPYSTPTQILHSPLVPYLAPIQMLLSSHSTPPEILLGPSSAVTQLLACSQPLGCSWLSPSSVTSQTLCSVLAPVPSQYLVLIQMLLHNFSLLTQPLLDCYSLLSA